MRELPKEPPHQIHGDDVNLCPTHTHGLERVGLPEMFINGKAFGNVDNANIINTIVAYLYLNESEWERYVKGEDMEISIYKDPSYPIFCLRKVDRRFAGVTTSYYHEDLNCITGFRQLYVKGDDHVLTDEYFLEEDKKSKMVECGPDCSGYKK